MKRFVVGAIVVIAAGALPRSSQAQSISITPQIGVYVPANSIDSLRNGAQQVRVKREGALALGLNLDLGTLRLSAAYVTDAKLNQETTVSGVESGAGKGKLLDVAGDLVLRPLPRILVQPYLLVGGGLRHANYSFSTNSVADAFKKDNSQFAFHAGIGADVMLGPVGVTAEITDFISKDTNGAWKQHDGFGFAGLKLRI